MAHRNSSKTKDRKRLLFLDNNFARKLIGVPKTQQDIIWQESVLEVFKSQYLPCSFLQTPFLFLELSGIGYPSRYYEISPFLKVGRLGQKRQFAESKGLFTRVYDTLYEHYCRHPMLSTNSIKTSLEEFGKKRVAGNRLSRFVANEAVYRYVRRRNYHHLLCQSLAVDELQLLLSSQANSEYIKQAQRSFLKQVMVLRATEQINYPIFRLIAKIFQLLERQKLRKGVSSAINLKDKEDGLDTEYITYGIMGAYSNNRLRTVNVLTCDPLEAVCNRANIGKGIFEIITSLVFPSEDISKAEIDLSIRPGRFYVFPNDPNIEIQSIDVNKLTGRLAYSHASPWKTNS